MTTYQSALDYLNAFIPPEHHPSDSPHDPSRNLRATRKLLALMGDPQDTLKCVVIAGTKGKGSTSAMIDAIAGAAGYRTGLWTSPHLSSYRERIQINRQLMSEAALIAAVAQLRTQLETHPLGVDGPPTTFALWFAIALRYFVDHGVELAVLEVGLGGRFDSSAVVPSLAAVISSISYDHTQLLGTTLREIAWNKAGIMHPATPAITVPQPPEVAAEFRRCAAEVGAPLHIAEEAGIMQATAYLPYPTPPYPTRLRGPFQHENARLALATILAIQSQGFRISASAMAQGLATAWWPGRFEVVQERPRVVVDGAHNGDSAQKLLIALKHEFYFERLILVFGTSRDKDIDAIAAALVPYAATLILTRSRHPRAMTDIETLATFAQPYLHGELVRTHDVTEAIAAAQCFAKPNDLICITGSLFIVAEAREAFGLAVAE